MNTATPYQFAFHERVKRTAPTGGTLIEFFDRLNKGEKLNRAEKNSLFHMIQANTNKYNYKISGWIFPFKSFMNRYLVNNEYYGWTEIWAFDKTCIRSSYYTNHRIIEIVEIDK